MNKLKFTKDEGSEFYKELNEQIEKYCSANRMKKTGNIVMHFKIILYFSLDIFFYYAMIGSTSVFAFLIFLRMSSSSSDK